MPEPEILSGGRQPRPARLPPAVVRLLGVVGIALLAVGLAVYGVVTWRAPKDPAVGVAVTSPEFLAPADSVAYLQFDLDLSQPRSRAFADVIDSLGASDSPSASPPVGSPGTPSGLSEDLAVSLFTSVIDDPELDFDDDLREWLGADAALVLMPSPDEADEGILPALVVSVTDETGARAALDYLVVEGGTGGITDLAYSVRDGWAVITEAALLQSFSAEDVLASVPAFTDSVSQIDTEAPGWAWLDVDSLVGASNPGALGILELMGVPSPSGRRVAVMTLDADTDGLLLSGRAFGLNPSMSPVPASLQVARSSGFVLAGSGLGNLLAWLTPGGAITIPGLTARPQGIIDDQLHEAFAGIARLQGRPGTSPSWSLDVTSPNPPETVAMFNELLRGFPQVQYLIPLFLGAGAAIPPSDDAPGRPVRVSVDGDAVIVSDREQMQVGDVEMVPLASLPGAGAVLPGLGDAAVVMYAGPTASTALFGPPVTVGLTMNLSLAGTATFELHVVPSGSGSTPR